MAAVRPSAVVTAGAEALRTASAAEERAGGEEVAILPGGGCHGAEEAT